MKRSQCYLVLIASIFCSMAYAQERITLEDGSRLSVYIVKPAQTLSEPSPLVILMGGGPGNASISRDTSIWLGGGFAERGWMVAVPVSPNNRAFRGDENNHKVEQLITELQKRDEVANGKVLLAGISNGGMSALEIARRNPANYMGVAAARLLGNNPLVSGRERQARCGQSGVGQGEEVLGGGSGVPLQYIHQYHGPQAHHSRNCHSLPLLDNSDRRRL